MKMARNQNTEQHKQIKQKRISSSTQKTYKLTSQHYDET